MSNVNLISVTPNAEKTILYIARASSNQENTDPGLIEFLIRSNHWSPFTLAHAVFEFKTSRTIAHQMIRHWSLACLESGDIPGVQEFSQRYAEAPNTVLYHARRQADSNRQSSIDDLPPETLRWFDNAQLEIHVNSKRLYQEAIAKGIAKECARFLLPEATETKLYLSGSIRSWIHYFRERCAEACQLEHRVLALEARKMLATHVPTISEALEWNV